MLRIICAVLIFTTCCFSCKKSKPEPTVLHINFSSAAIDFVDMQLGKYFIYKDSATGALDSVIVTQRTLTNVYVPAGGTVFATSPYYYQQYTLRMNNISTAWLNVAARSDNNSTGTTDTAMLALEDLTYTGPFFTYWHYYKDLPLPTMIIEGNSFANVMVQERVSGIPGDPFYRHSVIWWAKGKGIIKRRTIISGIIKTQTLLRHN